LYSVETITLRHENAKLGPEVRPPPSCHLPVRRHRLHCSSPFLKIGVAT
jgi:hypothetical protein